MLTAKAVIALSMLFLVSAADAADLPRRAALGVALAPLPKSSSGVLVRSVFLGLTAQKIGIREGDVILQVNAQKAKAVGDVVAAAASLHAGDKVDVTVQRSGRELHLAGRASAQPFEQYPTGIADYGAVPFRGGYLRDILAIPKSNPKAAVIFLIQGFTCATIEPGDPAHSYKRLGQGLVAEGVGYYRVEKPGIGDSIGPVKCGDIDYATELDAFRTAYNHLTKVRGVSPDRIFIFGHSLGGLEGPMLAAERPPRGLAVYGTVLRNWADYHHDLTRLQPYFTTGEDPVDAYRKSETLRPLFKAFYFDRKSPAEIARDNPKMADSLREVIGWDGADNALGRNYHYLQDLAQQPLMSAWRDSKTNVLSLYGESDLVALTDADHKLIADVVNHYRPGTAKYVEVARTDHPMTLVGSREEVRRLGASGKQPQSQFNPEIVRILTTWIAESMGKPPVAQR